MKLKDVVERNDTRAGRLFDIAIQLLIVISLISFSVETLPDLAPAMQSFLRYTEIACVAAFTVEYLLRIVVAERPLGFVFSFFGLVDLAAILPFYVTTGVDLRSLRAIRLLRLFRALKLVRYSAAIRRFHRAFIIAREELVLFASVTALLLYFAAVGIYYCERDAQPEVFRSVFDGLWWAVATLTTVGYGDVYPITAGGKVFTFVILMVGLGVVSVPAGLVASALARAREEEL